MEVKEIEKILKELKDSEHLAIEIGDIWVTDFIIEKVQIDENLYMGIIKLKMSNKEIMEHLKKG